MHIAYTLLHQTPTPEDEATLAWLHERPDAVSEVRLTGDPLSRRLYGVDVLWIHAPDRAAWEAAAPGAEALNVLRAYAEAGGRLLCTGFAARLPHALGVEPNAPETRPVEIVDKGFGRGVGFQSFRGHPLMAGFFGGVYLWYPDADVTVERVGYFDGQWPAKGRVLGIEKGYITLYQESRLLVEHEVGRGRILSAGAFVHFDGTNHLAAQLRQFVTDAFTYLAGPQETGAPATWWAPDDTVAKGMVVASAPLEVTGERVWQPAPRTTLKLARDPATHHFFDVVGRRCMMMGAERGGLDEIWVHPFRLLQELEIGVVEDGGVRWLRDVPARFEMRPEAATRTYRLPRGTLTETVVAPVHDPGGLVSLQADGTGPLSLVVRFRTDFRWMWPYAPDTLGSLRFGYDGGLDALHVRDRNGTFYALFGADVAPDDYLGGTFERIDVDGDAFRSTPEERNRVTAAFRYTLDAANGFRLHFAAAGTDQGREEAEQAYRKLLGAPEAVYRDAADHNARLLGRSTMLTTPDPVFDEGYRWAVVGTDRFWATTPGLGTGLLAGYGTGTSGWHGGHKVSGRPGYAWYFGRDAQWACFAVDGYGDFGAVRAQLDLFARFQDGTGKIFHELVTSGIAHYDAADATPLYVILAAHYLRHAGDVDAIRTLWPSLQRAMDFLYATDTDGDGYIENTNVGHGWIEGGALYGAHTTLYLAGLWVQTLRDAAYLADALGEADAADRFRRDADDRLERLERDFWNEEAQFYYYGKLRDGSFNPEQTILPAVLMHFGLLDAGRAQGVLRAYASNDFSTDWGARILSARSPLFNPRGYHYGSVWPLFTGWTALAEYAYGRSVQGFTHVMNNLRVYRHWGLGFVEEVLNGQHYEPAGVCAHQCWSETNVLHPIYAGLLGFEPDALHRRLRLSPRLPLDWDTFRADNLWVGPSRVHLAMQREAHRTTYTFTPAEGPALDVTFAPAFAAGTRITALRAGGEDRPAPALGRDGRPVDPVTFALDGIVEVHFEHTGGIGVLPHVPEPEPGDASLGYRVIDAGLDGDAYTVTVEGRAGTTGRFRVRRFGGTVERIEGAQIAETDPNGIAAIDVAFPESGDDYARQTFTVIT